VRPAVHTPRPAAAQFSRRSTPSVRTKGKNCWRSPTEFQLHSILTAATPLVDEEDFRSYEGAKIQGVAIDKLAYFGLSIFWRAAVRNWTVGREKDQRIWLGPYQEKLRLYLLGETGIPDGIVQLVTLSTALDNMHNRVWLGPSACTGHWPPSAFHGRTLDATRDLFPDSVPTNPSSAPPSD
jgi:hypothetical protein